MSQTPPPPQNIPSLQEIINRTRSEFYADAGQLHDKITKPYVIIITELSKKLIELEGGGGGGNKPKNRADRRREQRTQKKVTKKTKKITT